MARASGLMAAVGGWLRAILYSDGADVGAANPLPVTAGTVGLDTGRISVTGSVTIANGAFLSAEIDMRRYSGGDVYIPAAWTNADIGFHVAHTTAGTFVPLYDDNGNLVQATVGAVTSRAYSLPPEVFACRYIKLWSQLAGVNANQGGDRVMAYELKS